MYFVATCLLLNVLRRNDSALTVVEAVCRRVEAFEVGSWRSAVKNA